MRRGEIALLRHADALQAWHGGQAAAAGPEDACPTDPVHHLSAPYASAR